jgi:hypothetical protein
MCESGAVNLMILTFVFVHVNDFKTYEQELKDVVQEHSGPITADGHT